MPQNEIKIPRIIIAGTHSGCGKTTVATGLMGALSARGLTVQPFKVGPDFIDPTHHTSICGRGSRNLDPYMMGKDEVVNTFIQASEGADIAVIEGVMGLHDGVEGTGESSTADVAQILSCPTILVCDVKGMSRSVHAMILGYTTYDPKVTFAGVIYNRGGSDHHREMIGSAERVQSLGWIPRRDELQVKSRHLGLAMAGEEEGLQKSGAIVEECCTIDRIIQAASSAPPLQKRYEDMSEREGQVQIGVAMDAAFCFYYAENFRKLRRAGADLIFFSPMTDHLPDVDALYLGGGYPELHAAALEKNSSRQEIRKAADAGLPIFGECGGLVYLSRSLRTVEGSYAGVGVIPGDAEMKNRFQALGYVDGTVAGDYPLFPQDLSFRGHEFHYSILHPDNDCRYAFTLKRGKGIMDGKDGIIEGNTIAGYTHVYFTERFAEAFVAMAEKNKT
ncbi:cobyrinate a,c-diamide synthase [Methanocalculus sp.]|uniref:cobyrinate a,c-diamide synthase n=1 Tax=Methanocalculus sp. TaxID=2004547 RepID=UPI00272C0886|nr:cobyrinate a,c-diamide synthase [Methanocalculus sp.]